MRGDLSDTAAATHIHMKSNSYSQNLTQAILKEQKAFVWLMKLFHRDELDI